MLKRERWTEADVLALTAGEPDFFDRKSGALLDDKEYREKIAKALSAFANSGGGSLILGMCDDGRFDGVNPLQGKTRTREWLEQLIPNLLSYQLQDFRVHEVGPDSPSVIPPGRVVLVIDVGDSALAPHQTAVGTPIYYYRSGGHSRPAKHFYLELLRNRLVGPTLQAELFEVSGLDVRWGVDTVVVEMKLDFRVTNIGRVAAHKWALVAAGLQGCVESRRDDYRLTDNRNQAINLRLEPTILPGLWLPQQLTLSVILRPRSRNESSLMADFLDMTPDSLRVGYRVATETSPGEVFETPFTGLIDRTDLFNKLAKLMDR